MIANEVLRKEDNIKLFSVTTINKLNLKPMVQTLHPKRSRSVAEHPPEHSHLGQSERSQLNNFNVKLA